MSGLFAGQRRRVVALVAAVVVGVGMVAGCGSQGAEPEEKDWSEGDQQEKDNGKQQTGEDKPAEPEEPEEFVFVKEYIAEIGKVREGEDPEQLLAMSTEDCYGCQHMVDYHEEVYANGGKYVGDATWGAATLVDGPKGNDPVVIRIKTDRPDAKVIEKKGRPGIEIGGREEMSDFELVNEGGTWKVSNFCGVTDGQPSGCITQ